MSHAISYESPYKIPIWLPHPVADKISNKVSNTRPDEIPHSCSHQVPYTHPHRIPHQISNAFPNVPAHEVSNANPNQVSDTAAVEVPHPHSDEIPNEPTLQVPHPQAYGCAHEIPHGLPNQVSVAGTHEVGDNDDDDDNDDDVDDEDNDTGCLLLSYIFKGCSEIDRGYPSAAPSRYPSPYPSPYPSHRPQTAYPVATPAMKIKGNLVVNGDFEYNDMTQETGQWGYKTPTGWTSASGGAIVYGGMGYGKGYVMPNSKYPGQQKESRSGKQALVIEGAQKTVCQSVSTQRGARYNVSFMSRRQDPSAVEKIGVKIDGGWLIPATVPNRDFWTSMSKQFSASAPTTELCFINAATSGSTKVVHVDRVAVVRVDAGWMNPADMLGGQVASPAKGKVLGYLNTFRDYQLSFDVKFSGTGSGYRDIINIEDPLRTGLIGARLPLVTVVSGTRKLHIRTGSLSDYNAGCDPPQNLALNSWQSVQIRVTEMDGQTVFYNGAVACQTGKFSTSPYPGKQGARVMFGRTTNEAALVQVRNLKYEKMTAAPTPFPTPSAVGFTHGPSNIMQCVSPQPDCGAE
eukprot:jgi/Bigna1/135604/aug1.30_g10312